MRHPVHRRRHGGPHRHVVRSPVQPYHAGLRPGHVPAALLGSQAERARGPGRGQEDLPVRLRAVQRRRRRLRLRPTTTSHRERQRDLDGPAELTTKKEKQQIQYLLD